MVAYIEQKLHVLFEPKVVGCCCLFGLSDYKVETEEQTSSTVKHVCPLVELKSAKVTQILNLYLDRQIYFDGISLQTGLAEF